jgi:MFS family permease
MTAPSTQTETPRKPLLTRGLLTWLTAASVATLCDGILYFALGWQAARLGGQLAGAVLSLVLLPRVALLLLAGAAADRRGMRRTVLLCDALLCLLLPVWLTAYALGADGRVLLAALALALGVLSAFRMPAAGVFVRLFHDGPRLARAMSLSGSLLTLARLAGPPLGGVTVAALALTGVVGLVLVGYLLVLMLVLALRPPLPQEQPEQPGSTLHQVREAVLSAGQVPGAVPLLLAVAALAGALLPVLSLGLPLAGRARGWTAGQTGLIEAAWLAGTLAISLLVARCGTVRRAIVPLAVAPTLAAAGALLIALSSAPGPAAAGAIVMGVGTAGFTSHVFPLFVLQTPSAMLARFQSLLGIAQALPILLTTNGLGWLAERRGAADAITAAALLCLTASAVVLLSPALRTATLNRR